MRRKIAIVGAGINGLTAAYILAKSDFDVVLIDKADFEVRKSIVDGRAISIASTSQEALDKFGIWRLFGEDMGVISKVVVKDFTSQEFATFNHDDKKHAPLGYIVKSDVILNALCVAAGHLKNIKILDKKECVNVRFNDNSAVIELSDNTTVSADIVIAADGSTSQMRKILGLKNRVKKYHQVAYTFDITHEHAHNNIAYEFFYPNGPVACLPLCAPKQSSVVWTDKIETQNLDLSEQNIEDMVLKRVANTHGQCKIASKVKSFPLHMSHMTSYFKNRIVFIGDALHFIHPLAGQGYNLSLRDIGVLSGLLINYRDSGLDIGSSILFNEFERKRKLDNLSMIAFTDGINRLFSNNSSMLGFLRNVGLYCVNNSHTLKTFFTRCAVGGKIWSKSL